MFKDKTIRNAVMSAIESKIEEAQEVYNERIESINNTLIGEIEHLKNVARLAKERAANDIISEILKEIV